MKESFKHLLKRPLVCIYLAATAIGNTSFLYSVFSIFMLPLLGVISGLVVGVVIGIGLMALHQSISKKFINSGIGISFSWVGIVLIMGLSMVGWFLIFHHVTFGLTDLQHKKQTIIQSEFKRIESGNDRFMDSLRVTYQNGYKESIKNYHPQTAEKAGDQIQKLASKKMYIDQQTVNNKLNLFFEGNSFRNILLSYIQRFRKALGDTAAEVLLWIMAILLSGGIDVCGFAFNRVTKDIQDDEQEKYDTENDEIDLFDDVTETEEFKDEYYINNSDENTLENVTPETKKNIINVTQKKGEMSLKKKEIWARKKKIKKLIQGKNLTQEEIGKKLNVDRRTIIRDLAAMNGELSDD